MWGSSHGGLRSRLGFFCCNAYFEMCEPSGGGGGGASAKRGCEDALRGRASVKRGCKDALCGAVFARPALVAREGGGRKQGAIEVGHLAAVVRPIKGLHGDR